MITDFNNISSNSRIWIYGSKTILSKDFQSNIINSLSQFLDSWEYHKNPLTSAVSIFENRFVIVALDDKEYGVGGCSIDSLQRMIQEIERRLDISLLDRLNVFCKINEEIRCINVHDLKIHANKDTLFFDLTLQRKSELSSFLKAIRDGWCFKFVC